LGCPVDVLDMSAAVRALVGLIEVGRLARPGRPAVVVTLNPEMVMRARRDPRFRDILEGAALLVPDGIGLVRALRRRGHAEATRVGGTDLLLAYLPEAVRLGHRVALAGAAPGVAQLAAARLARSHPGLQVVAADAGDPDAALAGRLREARPDVVLAAFGAGRQERFLNEALPGIGATVGIGVGGSLDYFAGRVRRAPEPVRRAGLEWSWRLVRQPWRIRRQLVLPGYWWLERREASRLRKQLHAAAR
jgi:N-acetylglucosaminyldiphosphoundecaprenol N-acetyl-beta-D-mannosaminyltransferase